MNSGFVFAYMIVGALIGFVVLSAVIWGLSRLLKFKEEGFAPALKTAGVLMLFQLTLSGLTQLFAPHYTGTWMPMLVGYGFTTLLSLTLETFLVKTFFKESYAKAIALVAIQLLLYVVFMGGIALLVFAALSHSHF